MSLSRLFALCLLLVLPLTACAQALQQPVKAGVDYEVLKQGQRWQAPDGKIEVVEVFAYWCHHCDDFQPMVDTWKKKLPADVRFRYIAAAFDPEDVYAQAFFAAESANAVAKIHQPMFDAIHRLGTLPRSNPTAGELGTWFEQQGLNRAKMIASMGAKGTVERMTRSRQFMIANNVKGTPALVVNGKYVVTTPRLEDRLRVVDALIAMERAAARK